MLFSPHNCGISVWGALLRNIIMKLRRNLNANLFAINIQVENVQEHVTQKKCITLQLHKFTYCGQISRLCIWIIFEAEDKTDVRKCVWSSRSLKISITSPENLNPHNFV